MGHEAMVKLLIGREDVNPHMPDKSGITTLLYATNKGNRCIINLINDLKNLPRPPINPEEI